MTNDKREFNFCGLERVVWRNEERPTPTEILKLVKDYLASDLYRYYDFLGSYYNSMNYELAHEVQYKRERKKSPNWFVPSAYYSTIIDTMAGYLFNNIVYSPADDSSDNFGEELNSTFKQIDIDITDMMTGTRALAFNKGAEIVYTYGDGETEPNIDVVSVDPRQMLFVYDGSIEPEVLFAIRITKSDNKDILYYLDVIYADEWTSYYVKRKEGAEDVIDVNPDGINKTLYWSECPCIEYNTELLSSNSPFHQIIPYVKALDALLTGNSNELDKLADAILTLSKHVSDEDKKNMGEWKLIDGLEKDDIVQYVQRQITPEFRDYMSRWLVQEIHKHSHVIDFYSESSSAAGDASGRALRTRLVDQNVYSMKLEKTVKTGFSKRIRLFKDFFNKTGSAYTDEDQIDIVFNRPRVIGAEDIAPLLVAVDFMSNQTKQELSGLDPQKEEERKESEKEESVDITDTLDPEPRTIMDATIDESDMPQE